jgi:hypothetical protein
MVNISSFFKRSFVLSTAVLLSRIIFVKIRYSHHKQRIKKNRTYEFRKKDFLLTYFSSKDYAITLEPIQIF